LSHHQTGEIDAGETQNVGRGDSEENRGWSDTSTSSDLVGATFDFRTDFEEIGELLLRFVRELTIVFGSSGSGLEAENERTTCDDTRTTRKIYQRIENLRQRFEEDRWQLSLPRL
jgi:inhibitor of KinA sporulation pathway (predicted exonuclease)